MLKSCGSAPATGHQVHPHPQTTGVGTIANQTQLQLSVGVAAVISPKLQPIGGAQNQICVAIIIKVSRHDRLNWPGLTEAQLRSNIREAALSQITPDSHATPVNNHVQPAVVVVIDQQNSFGLQTLERNMRLL